MSSSNPGALSPAMRNGYVDGPVGRPAVWEDIVNLPEHLNAEIIDGRIHYASGNRFGHAHAVGRVHSRIEPQIGNKQLGGWWIVPNPALAIGHGSWVAPDLAGIRKERCPDPPDDYPLALVPDWVCEVLSPSNAHYDRGDKGKAYAKAGVAWYWLVDPAERFIEVWQLVGSRWQIFGVFTDGAVVGLPPFEDVPLTVSEIFLPKKAAAAVEPGG